MGPHINSVQSFLCPVNSSLRPSYRPERVRCHGQTLFTGTTDVCVRPKTPTTASKQHDDEGQDGRVTEHWPRPPRRYLPSVPRTGESRRVWRRVWDPESSVSQDRKEPTRTCGWEYVCPSLRPSPRSENTRDDRGCGLPVSPLSHDPRTTTVVPDDPSTVSSLGTRGVDIAIVLLPLRPSAPCGWEGVGPTRSRPTPNVTLGFRTSLDPSPGIVMERPPTPWSPPRGVWDDVGVQTSLTRCDRILTGLLSTTLLGRQVTDLPAPARPDPRCLRRRPPRRRTPVLSSCRGPQSQRRFHFINSLSLLFILS